MWAERLLLHAGISVCSSLAGLMQCRGVEVQMGRISRSMGKDRDAPEKASKIYWCAECNVAGVDEMCCEKAEVIGWVENG